MVSGTRSRHTDGLTHATPGMPDLFVLPARSHNGAWVAIEVKALCGRVRPAQHNLIECGASHIVRTTQEAVALIEGQPKADT